jgi:ABC-type transport system involved in multi-copper enzyme maturation permease subunit
LVRRLVDLKARLTWNGFRNDTQRKFGLPIAVALIGWLGLYLARTHLEVSRRLETLNPEAAFQYMGWAALVLFVVWITLPVIIFPLDENLDPQQLAMLPIGGGQMVVGLAAASLVAPATIVPVAALTANAMALPSAWWIVLPSSLVFVCLLSVGSQLFSAAISAILRSRRGRDIATFLILGIAASSFFIYRVVSGEIDRVGVGFAALSNPIMDWAAVIPPVAAQRAMLEAASGEPVAALGFLAASLAGLAVLALVWRRLLGWLLTTPQEGSRPAARARRLGMATGPWGLIATLTRKELRFYVRDPRQRLVWTGTVIFVGLAIAGTIMGTTGLYDISDDTWAPLAAPVLVLFVGLPIALNLFGWERNAASYLFALPVKPHQMLLGKNAAVAIALTIEATILAVAIAAVTGHWGWIWLTGPLLVAAVGCQLAVGNLVSVLTPLRLPREGTDVFAQSTEQGCLAIVSQTISFFGIGLLLVPPASVITLTVSFGEVIPGWFAALAVTAYGMFIYVMALFIASKLLRRRIPEVLSWVQVV